MAWFSKSKQKCEIEKCEWVDLTVFFADNKNLKMADY